MNVAIFGATGMIGQGVLRECLHDPDVVVAKAVGRSATGATHPKLRDVVFRDMRSVTAIEPELRDIDACFFCIGVTSAGKAEAAYEHVTYDIPVAAATTLARLNPSMTFIYVSGAGADSSEHGRGDVGTREGKSRERNLYNVLYALFRPLLPVLRRVFRGYVLTTDEIGLAMLIVARRDAPKRVLESRNISALLESRTGSTTTSS